MKLIYRYYDSDIEHGINRFTDCEHINIIEHPTANECMKEYTDLMTEHNKNTFDYTPLEIVGVLD